jgi:tight adherence protein C
MIDTALLLSILVFTGFMLVCSGIFYYIRNHQERGKIIEKLQGKEKEPILASSTYTSSQEDNWFKNNLMNFMSSLGDIAKPKNEAEILQIRKKFLRAGYRRQNILIIFFGFKILLAALLPLCLFFLKVFLMKTIVPVHFMTFSILLALFGFYLPNIWLNIKIARRREKILEGFPDALDLMVVCVEAGMGLDAAINRVGEEMKLNNKVVSEEFNLVSLELRAGKLRRDALRNLAMRTDLEDVHSLVSLLIQTDKFGTSMAQALRVYSDAMRTRRSQRAEELAAKLPVKLLLPLIFFIFPSLFITIIGPAVVKISRILLPTLTGQ